MPGPTSPGASRLGEGARLDRLVAIGATVALGLRVDITYGITLGSLLALALTPVWLPSLLGRRPGRVLTVLVILAVVSGAVLTSFSAADHTVLTNVLLTRSVVLVGLLASVGTLLWAASLTSVRVIAMLYATGMVLGIPFNVSADPNLWRFTLAIPVCVFLLALTSMQRRLWPQLLALLVLAGVSVLNDSRSNSAMLLLAAVALVLQRVSSASTARRRGIGSVVSLAVAALLIFNLAQAAILEGYFGEVTQQRTQAQIEQSGSLLLGGRPEIAASQALVALHPLGLGTGIKASYEDVVAAKQGMAAIGYDPDNGYVERFMFGSGIEVHSVVGDLWLWCGLAGLALALALGVLTVGGFGARIRDRGLDALSVFLTIRLLWDLVFSPFGSATRLLPLVLALSMLAIGAAALGARSAPAPSGRSTGAQLR